MDFELCKAQLEALRAKQKAAGMDAAIDSGFSDFVSFFIFIQFQKYD